MCSYFALTFLIISIRKVRLFWCSFVSEPFLTILHQTNAKAQVKNISTSSSNAEKFLDLCSSNMFAEFVDLFDNCGETVITADETAADDIHFVSKHLNGSVTYWS